MAAHTACLLSRPGFKEIGQWLSALRTGKPASVCGAVRLGGDTSHPAGDDRDHFARRVGSLVGRHMQLARPRCCSGRTTQSVASPAPAVSSSLRHRRARSGPTAAAHSGLTIRVRAVPHPLPEHNTVARPPDRYTKQNVLAPVYAACPAFVTDHNGRCRAWSQRRAQFAAALLSRENGEAGRGQRWSPGAIVALARTGASYDLQVGRLDHEAPASTRSSSLTGFRT
jgi:hypothetical protein